MQQLKRCESAHCAADWNICQCSFPGINIIGFPYCNKCTADDMPTETTHLVVMHTWCLQNINRLLS